ncbi:hypothetical protein F4779DRAFT_618193 [Xylariaceae sp. FL0662B]|nr:hypothetical protein F4779DRAFT_618193 [Xylariaceae sp. FL0662B]
MAFAMNHTHPRPDGMTRPPRPRQWHLSRPQAHLVAATGEFVGTFWFLFFGYAGHLMVLDQAAGTGGASQITYIALAYGFSLLVTVWAFYRISGGLFNPATRRSPWACA